MFSQQIIISQVFTKISLLGSPVGSSKEPLVNASTVTIYLEIVPE